MRPPPARTRTLAPRDRGLEEPVERAAGVGPRSPPQGGARALVKLKSGWLVVGGEGSGTLATLPSGTPPATWGSDLSAAAAAAAASCSAAAALSCSRFCRSTCICTTALAASCREASASCSFDERCANAPRRASSSMGACALLHSAR